jgi:ferredoxin--NADP+ reductase
METFEVTDASGADGPRGTAPPTFRRGAIAAPTDKATEERILDVRRWTDSLISFRTTRHRSFRFKPGQFARLGVASGKGGIVWRAYSMVSADYDEHLDFFSIIVPEGAFTTRLARLGVGDTLWVEKQAFGFLTTDRFAADGDLWMLASGTGVAPFLSILRDPSVWERFDHLVLAYSVRRLEDLAYRDEIAALAHDELFAPHGHKLRFVPVVTREQVPGMLDRRLTALCADGTLEREVGLTFDAARSRVLICGNPQMLDDLRDVLTARGLKPDRSREPGNLAFENYW